MPINKRSYREFRLQIFEDDVTSILLFYSELEEILCLTTIITRNIEFAEFILED